MLWSVCAFHCSDHRMLIAASLLLIRLLFAPGKGDFKSAITNANAALLNTRDCLDATAAIVAPTVPVLPKNETAALFAGAAVTVCS